jgi:BirA family biotin operon repressor/biotin-[acetyl-CoA-carboxylase] ligase
VILNPADTAALTRAGRQAFRGFRLVALAATPSTQDVARAAARAGAEPGFTCVAGVQSAGRGRQDRRWDAPDGAALLSSTVVRVDPRRLGGAPIAAGLAVRAAIVSTSGYQAALKWPNDVMAAARKLAGILCEVEPAAPGQGTAVCVGVGVNLQVHSFPDGIPGASLHELVARPPSAAGLLGALLTELAARLERLHADGLPGLRAEWMEHAVGMGQTVTARSATSAVIGVAEGIDDDGALIVRTATGPVRVLAADVHIGLTPPG